MYKRQGQNAISQAREFCKAANATGIILTKLDGTAKGGCVVAVSYTHLNSRVSPGRGGGNAKH